MKSKRLTIAAALFCLLLLIYDESITSACLDALTVSVKRVIPALFPYMVMSSIVVSLDLAAPVSRFIPMRLFALPDCAAPVLLTGILCGYPVGASGSAALFESGKISKDEASRLCALSGHVSPAFLIGTVGTLWSSKAFGWYLFACGIIFTLVSGFLTARRGHSSARLEHVSSVGSNRDFASVFCQSVTGAALSCLNVTGFIVFFRAAGAAFSSVIPAAAPIFSVLFEFSSGTVYSSGIGGIIGAALTGFAVGFSGFSVLAQTAAYAVPHKIPLKPYITSKLAEGIFMACAAALFCVLFSPDSTTQAFMPLSDSCSPLIPVVPAILAFIGFTGDFLSRGNKFRMKT